MPSKHQANSKARHRHNFRHNKNEHVSANVADEVLAVVGMVSHDDYMFKMS